MLHYWIGKNTDICSDILEWDNIEYPTGIFQFIWASPPCSENRRAKTTELRTIQRANKIKKTIKKIYKRKFPHLIIAENTFMKDLDCKDVDDCKYALLYLKRNIFFFIKILPLFGSIRKKLLCGEKNMIQKETTK